MKRIATLAGLVVFLLLPATLLAAEAYTRDVDGAAIIPSESSWVFAPTLEDIQLNVFTPTCALVNCHDAGQMANLDLRDGFAYSNLVSVVAFEDSTAFRVKPFDPDASYLVCKLEECPWIAWMRMPPPVTGPALDPAVIAVIRAWILFGALESGMPVAAGDPFETGTWGRVKSLYH